MTDKVTLVEVGQFTTVQNDNLADHNICKDDIIYIAGDMFVPIGEEDPYVMRRIFLCAKMKGDNIDANSGAFTVDGNSLKAVDEFTQVRLDKQRVVDFGEE